MDLLNQLQKYIGEFEKGKLYTIAARPGMGKTVIAKQLEKELTGIKNKDVLFMDTCLDKHIEQVGPCEYMEHSKLKDIASIEWEIKYSKAEIIILNSYQMVNKYNKKLDFSLKKLAEKYEKSIIVLSNVSRKCDRRRDKHPKRKDMTKKICQGLWSKSNVVMFLYREKYYNSDAKENILEIDIRKNNGNTGVFKVDFKILL